MQVPPRISDSQDSNRKEKIETVIQAGNIIFDVSRIKTCSALLRESKNILLQKFPDPVDQTLRVNAIKDHKC
jgi:adenylate kinase family enzyme